MTNEQVKAIAEKLNVSFEQAQTLVATEQKRTAAGLKYRTSAAYKLRLEQQKQVRALLRNVSV